MPSFSHWPIFFNMHGLVTYSHSGYGTEIACLGSFLSLLSEGWISTLDLGGGREYLGSQKFSKAPKSQER